MARNHGYAVYMTPILDTHVDLEEIALHEAAGTGLAVGGFIDRTTLLPASANVSQYGTGLGETYGLTIGSLTYSITNAALASNVATLTIGTHGITEGSRLVVAGLPSPFASLNGTHVVTGIAANTVSFAKTGSDIASAAVVAGTATGGQDLKLDGTDPPVRLLGLKSGPPTSSTGEESESYWDDTSQGFEMSEATSKSASIDFSGKIDFNSTAYKLIRLLEKGNVSQGLMAKLALIGPRGYTETYFAFGRFNSFTPDNSAGKTASFQTSYKVYGSYGLVLHNA